jgi:hypothetical protein
MNALITRLRGLVRRSSCPVPNQSCPTAQRRRQFLRLWTPLILFAVPTVIIAYGFVIPRSCIAGFNGLTFGFATTVLGACTAYAVGIRTARRG